MKLEEMPTKELLDLHNRIADKPAGPKTFATRTKLVARIEQIAADKVAMGDTAQWLKGNEHCIVTLWNGNPLTVAAPNFVELAIAETDPGVRGDTSGGGGKPAKLETGAVVRVPLFVNQGEVIKVDTRTGEYVGRVK